VRVLALKSYEVRATCALFEAMIRCMKTALQEVSSNGSRHEDMGKTIQVRVSDELHQIIKEWAEIEGISMAALIRREFEVNPLERDQIELRSDMRLRSYKGDIPESVRLIREGRGDW
jgi:hypothetical protein